jgi:hypothetical protein
MIDANTLAPHLPRGGQAKSSSPRTRAPGARGHLSKSDLAKRHRRHHLIARTGEQASVQRQALPQALGGLASREQAAAYCERLSVPDRLPQSI